MFYAELFQVMFEACCCSLGDTEKGSKTCKCPLFVYAQLISCLLTSKPLQDVLLNWIHSSKNAPAEKRLRFSLRHPEIWKLSVVFERHKENSLNYQSAVMCFKMWNNFRNTNRLCLLLQVCTEWAYRDREGLCGRPGAHSGGKPHSLHWHSSTQSIKERSKS